MSGAVASSDFSWAFTSNLSFVSKQYGGLQNDANPQTIIDGYALLGARATLNGPGDRWSVALFGTNLTDKRYRTAGRGTLVRQMGFTYSSVGLPRQIGAELAVDF